MGGSPQVFFQVSKKFVSAQFQLMAEQAVEDPSLVATFGLLLVGHEYASTPHTENLIFRMAEAVRAAAGGISHAELDAQMEGPSQGFWIFMKRNRTYTIVDTPQSPDYY